MSRAISLFLDHYSVDLEVPDLFYLQRIGKAFSHLPYENVTKILKQSRSSNSHSKLRQSEEVLEDHLQWNTGGTCFSLCNTLLTILKASGYQAFIAMADMRYGVNIHCAVVVQVSAQDYLIDPGYLLHEPFRLPGENQESVHRTAMNTVILKSEGEDVFSLYTIEKGVNKWRYRLRARPTPTEEFIQHWIHSFSLNSMEHITLSRISDAGRIYFRKNRIEQVSPNLRTTNRIPESDADVLSQVFGIPNDLISQAQRSLSGCL